MCSVLFEFSPFLARFSAGLRTAIWFQQSVAVNNFGAMPVGIAEKYLTTVDCLWKETGKAKVGTT